jgi:N-acetylglutamate synthase-like GNAT family acetyltransferase
VLLFKDIMARKTMDTLYKRAREMVTYVKGHQVIAAIYLTKQSEKNKSTTLLSSCLTVSWRGRSLSKKWPYHSLSRARQQGKTSLM